MIDCPRGEIRDQLPDLLHGHLDEMARARVVAHVAGCEACADELRLLRTARAALVRSSPVSAERAVRVIRAVPRARRRPPVPAWTMRIAASLVLLLTGAVAVALIGGFGSDRESSPVAVAVETPRPADLVISTDAGLFVGGLADLDDIELEEMLGTLETLELLPAEEPPPLVHGFEISEG